MCRARVYHAPSALPSARVCAIAEGVPTGAYVHVKVTFVPGAAMRYARGLTRSVRPTNRVTASFSQKEVRYDGSAPKSSRHGGRYSHRHRYGRVRGRHRVAPDCAMAQQALEQLPPHTMDNMRMNMTWDGLFHALALLIHSSLTEHRLT